MGQPRLDAFFARQPQQQPQPQPRPAPDMVAADPAGPPLKRQRTETKQSEKVPDDVKAQIEAKRQEALKRKSAAGSTQQLVAAASNESRSTGEVGEILRGSVGESWQAIVLVQFEKEYFKKLVDFLQSELAAKKTVYPELGNVFAWTRMCDFSSIKVVILGQDPYHGPGQAHGLCFSVQPGVRPPPSLVNIYKELEADIPGFKTPPHGYLTGWARQGVLLLNTCLTVRKGEANSHANRGWEQFTDAVIQAVNEQNSHVVFILWGGHAAKKGAKIMKKKHCVLQGPHPSPLSAHRGFFGCKHFSQANAYLVQHNKEPIDWTALDVESA